MAIALKAEPDFTLGRLCVSPVACRVTGERGARRLQPRVMQVLVALARSKGEVVTRDQLIDLAWDGAVVGEDAITRAIGHIRRLSEWDDSGAFQIRTVPTIGYVLEPGSEVEDGAADPLLAVLPFDNLSDDPNLRYVSEGLAEEILQTIARGATIRLIGRSSSFQFRGERKQPQVIARELRATHMLDGSVRQVGDRVRITAHLTETASRMLVWSDRFECARHEILDLQDSIAGQVAAALNRTFARSRRPGDIDPVGYDLYLRGAEFCRDIAPESQRQAIALLEVATQRIPDFADAWGELALARAQARFLRFEPRPIGEPDDRQDIEAAAARARALDPDCAPARLIPFVGGPLFDFTEHRRRFEEARPSRLSTTASPDVSLGVQLLEVGRVVEALEHFRQADQFDPLFQILIFYHCHALAAVGSEREAIDRLDAAIARWPPIPFFTAARVRWAALAGDWATVDTLMSPERLARFPLHHRAAETAAFVEACQSNRPSSAGIKALRDQAFALGKCGLEPLLLHARTAGLAEAMALCDRAGQPLVDVGAPRRPDDIGATSLFLPAFASVRQDPLFPTLCVRLGLAAHWQGGGVWPTCADEHSAGAFQDACARALVEFRQHV